MSEEFQQIEPMLDFAVADLIPLLVVIVSTAITIVNMCRRKSKRHGKYLGDNIYKNMSKWLWKANIIILTLFNRMAKKVHSRSKK